MLKQNELIKKYLELYHNPPLRQISEDTGIHMSRVFRILNGSEMRIGEYQSFIKAIHDKKNVHKMEHDFTVLIKECLEHLSDDTISVLLRKIRNTIKIQQLIHD